MQSYLQSILPRLQRYSKQLNDEANFVEISWAYMDDDGAKITYLFRRNKELLVTKQGEVATGRWEYLPSMQSLLIDYEGKRRMYNQGFLDKTVLLLRKEGTEQLLPLANVNLLPDLNIIRYIEDSIKLRNDPVQNKEVHTVEKPRVFKLSDGRKIKVWNGENSSRSIFSEGAKVTFSFDNSALPNGSFTLSDGDKILILSGRIIKYEQAKSKLLLTYLFILLAAISFLIFYGAFSGS